MSGWTQVKDGPWTIHTRLDGGYTLMATEHGRGEWSWSVLHGLKPVASGSAATARMAKVACEAVRRRS